MLTRTVISFTTELNLLELTICPRHRSSLGIGWRRGSNKCQIRPPISNHDSQAQKVAKAERGLGKKLVPFDMEETETIYSSWFRYAFT